MAEKLIVDNRRARHDYHLSDKVEAGLVLSGTEVKSLRAGQATLQQAYAEVRDKRRDIAARDAKRQIERELKGVTRRMSTR